ncbi:50S ribosomal protein L21 [bacterium SM23_31]|nr:MAG: 50S ribosomal protein L21 [bacterium SM23_31]
MSFAVVEIAGKQFQVREQEELEVPKLHNEVGESVVFDRVLLLSEDGETHVGMPTVEKAKVAASILQHGRYKKITVFKKKRRKDYKKTVGHRQDYSVIKIDSISVE